MIKPAPATSLQSVEALILAGGMGTRIGAVLGATPKLLAPLAGRPFLDYLVAWLSGYGVKRIVLSLGHLAEEVVDRLDASPYPGVEIIPVIETEPLGTAGGIANARAQLHSDPALVLNGDSYVNADLGAFLDFHGGHNFGASLLCTRVDDAARYGSVEINADGAIAAFREKQSGGTSAGYISAGVYLLSAAALDDIAALKTGSIERDFFAVQPPFTLGGYGGEFNFIDFGTPESYETAQKFFADLPFANENQEPR